MRTEQQQKNHEAIEKWKAKQKQRLINYLNENEMIVWYIVGLMCLGMVGALAVALA